MTSTTLRRVVRLSLAKDVPGVRPTISLEHVEQAAASLADTEIPESPAGDSIAFEPGDVLFSKLRPYLAKSLLVTRPMFGSSEFLAMQPDATRLDSRYLLYITLSTPWLDWAVATSYGTKMPRTSWDQMADFSFMLPALNEQRRIADFLDDQVARLDRLRELRSNQVQLFRDRFADLRETLVETGVAYTPLKELTSRARPINYGVLMPGPEIPDGIPLVEAGDVVRGAIRVAALRRAAPEIELEFRRSRLRRGDCVMAIRGSIGAVQTIPSLSETVNVTRDAARIVPSPGRVRSEFLRQALTTRRAQDWLRLRAGGAAVKGINIADLRRLPTPCPPLDEQLRIEKELIEAERDNLRAQQLVASFDTLTVERKQSLITAAVTGQFDVTTARGMA